MAGTKDYKTSLKKIEIVSSVFFSSVILELNEQPRPTQTRNPYMLGT